MVRFLSIDKMNWVFKDMSQLDNLRNIVQTLQVKLFNYYLLIHK